MLLNLRRTLKTDYKNSLKFISGIALVTYSTCVLFALLAVMMADQTDAKIAGLFMAFLNFLELLFFDYLGGNMADFMGSKTAMKFQAFFNVLAGTFLLLFPQNILNIFLIGLFLFIGYGMNVYRVYLLRTTNKEEGGTIFGIGDNLISLAFLLGTLSIPFFAQNRSYFWLAVLMILTNIILFIILHFIKKEKFLDKPKTSFSVLNPLRTIRKSLDFIKKGNYFPLMAIAAALFGGLFYGSIWFIFPLKFAASGNLSLMDGLELGVYDLVTVFTAGLCGHLADKYNWKRMHLSGWIIVLVGMWMLPLLNFRMGLIIAGLIIGIGNNLFYYSAYHALEKYDKVHKEDGAFTAFTTMCETLGYALSPALVGVIYFYHGFTLALIAGISMASIVALFMIVFSIRMGKFRARA